VTLGEISLLIQPLRFIALRKSDAVSIFIYLSDANTSPVQPLKTNVYMFTKGDIEKYFLAEKQESLLFLAIGVAGIVTALVFFFYLKTPFYKGAAVPLFLIGSLLGVVGYAVYNRSDGDRVRNVYAYDMNPGDLKDKELPRMKVVMKNFVAYRYTEMVLAIVGMALFLYFRNKHSLFFWKGFGLTLTIMAVLALFADYFAEKRGHIYIKGVESFVNRTAK
jgi:hypothetical protein